MGQETLEAFLRHHTTSFHFAPLPRGARSLGLELFHWLPCVPAAFHSDEGGLPFSSHPGHCQPKMLRGKWRWGGPRRGVQLAAQETDLMRGKWRSELCFHLKPLRLQEEAPCLRTRREGQGPWKAISGKMTMLWRCPWQLMGRHNLPGWPCRCHLLLRWQLTSAHAKALPSPLT